MENLNQLSHLSDLAKNSYRNISFNPEKRGSRTIEEYNAELMQDLIQINALGKSDPERAQQAAELYKSRYMSFFTKWLSSQSNCASAFIVGPSNFPSQRMQKRSNWADQHFSNFRNFRVKALKAIERSFQIPVDELAETQKKLQNAIELQKLMKRVNAVHSAFVKNPNSLDKVTDLDEKYISKIKNYVAAYSWEPHPFAPYQLTNNNNRIKYYQGRLAVLETKKSLAESNNSPEVSFDGGKVFLNYSLDRVQLLFDAKPNPETISMLKRNGFKWSPTAKAWQRKITGNAKYAVRLVTGVTLPC